MDRSLLDQLVSEFEPADVTAFWKQHAQPAIFDIIPSSEDYTWVFDLIVDALEIAATYFLVSPEQAFSLFIDKIISYVIDQVVSAIFGDATDSPAEATAEPGQDDLQDRARP